MKFNHIRLALLPSTLLACASLIQAAEVTVSSPDSQMLRFALGKLEAALKQPAHTLQRTLAESPDQDAEIVVSVDPTRVAEIGAEGFRRVSSDKGLRITACDERGAMYGVLDLAEQIRMGTPWNRVEDRTVKPQLGFRAIKFNLPWSAYRTSPSFEQHQETCKDLQCWEAFLDMMAENRFNVLSLWSLHPYTYMIRPRNFPEACPFSKDYVGGVISGSECYIPALDYITKDGPHKTWRWAFQRQWLFYAVWGKLLYDPATPDAQFEAMFDERFGKGTGKDLLAAWKLASRVPLHFASFNRGTWDGSLYTEGFSSWIDKDDGARGFFGIDDFIRHPVLDTKRYVNIADFVKAEEVAEPGKLSPLALAAQLDHDGAEALQRVAAIRARTKPSPTLECELTDIETSRKALGE